ncbi:hypothetical protein EDC96DRAFT_548800 [Choanephora cucurbitarum]|nr:hypothetical protein EDC96DRAFT_548800 [Choanephora cucurbitarum]
MNTGYWILDIGYWILDIGYWILDIGYQPWDDYKHYSLFKSRESNSRVSDMNSVFGLACLSEFASSLFPDQQHVCHRHARTSRRLPIYSDCNIRLMLRINHNYFTRQDK